MTVEERWLKANEEYQALTKWANEESEKVSKRLASENIIQGLDTNREAYSSIREEYKRRVLALFDKYELASKPKL